MPYDVSGWVEYTSATPDKREELTQCSLWSPLLALSPFGLGGDEISQYLFGLSKGSQGSGCFGYRGIPWDCSDLVRHQVRENDAWIAKYGEGDFGHTFASFADIRDALDALDAPKDESSEWHQVISTVEFVRRQISPRHSPMSQHLRFIVWANW